MRELVRKNKFEIPVESKIVKIVPKRGGGENCAFAFYLPKETADFVLRNQKIFVGLFQCPIERYRNQCYNCYEFGHFAKNCVNSKKCGKCAADDHLFKYCKNDCVKCVNCCAIPGYIPHSSFETWKCFNDVNLVQRKPLKNAPKNQEKSQEMQ